MVLINEWLPNPEGKDTDGEFVEIYNSGKESVGVSGWSLKANSKTKFVLKGEVWPGGFLVFKKPELKISLNNTDGEVFLYDAAGRQIDRQQFLGLAPEGKSYSRTQDGNFVFSEVSLGGVNKFFEETAMISSNYQIGQPLKVPLGVLDVILLTLGVASVLTGLMLFIIKSNENISKLFFARDEEVWS